MIAPNAPPQYKVVVDGETGEESLIPLTPEELAAANALAEADASGQAIRTFEVAEDDERLRLVNERAAQDPAFAALAELALKGDVRV